MRQSALLRSGKSEDAAKSLDAPARAPVAKRRRKSAGGTGDATPRSAAHGSDHFVVRGGLRCAGVHLIVDVFEGRRLDDIDHIETTLRRCVEAARATLLHIHLHHFQPNGVSGVAVLAESHISIHTWPDAHYAAIDVFMCGRADPDKCVPVLREAFGTKRVVVSELLRGRST
jgi:S-adenosylmethionine decarboxylase